MKWKINIQIMLNNNKYKPEIWRSTCGRKLQEELLLSVLTNETPTRNKNNNVIYLQTCEI